MLKKYVKSHISLISEVLASLSIIFAAIIFIYDFFESKKSDISAAILLSKTDQLALFMNNTGGTDIVLQEISINVPSVDLDREVTLIKTGYLLEKEKSKIVTSLESKLHSTVIYNERVHGNDYPLTQCFVNIQYISPNGQVKTEKISTKCVAATLRENK